MSFLAPLFLLGALAVGLPIFFHLIRRSSKEQVPFSSLMFLQPAPPRVTKRSRLEHVLLLLLRCLIICLLALGFSRPFFQKPMMAAESNQTSSKTVILVDASASMKREGLWSEALDRASEALRSTTPADQVAVFTFDTRLHPLVSFEQWTAMGFSERPALTASRLTALKPGWAATHLGNALTSAAEALTESDKQGQKAGRRRIIVVTDLQEGSRLEGLQGYDWPKGLEVQVVTVQPKRPTNAGLQWMVESDDSARPDADLSPRIRVINSANAQREQFQVKWDGVSGTTPLDVYVPPGQNRVVHAPALPTNAVGERLVLTGDDDDFDNTVFVLQPHAENIHVLFLGDEPDEAAQPFFYLKRAFQQTRRQTVEVKAHPTAIPLTTAELGDTRLLIATDRLPDNQLAAVQSFVADGGTILFVMKNTASAASIGRLAGVDNFAAAEIAPPSYAMFSMVDFTHPLFASFSDPRFNDFTKIHFWKYRRLDAAKLPDARVLARFDSGDPAFIEIPRGKGRVLALASGWQPSDSQLALSSKFVPLLYAMLDLSGGIKGQVTQFHIGDEINLAAFANLPVGQPVVVQKPDGTPVTLAAGETRFSQTDVPGIYSVAAVRPPLRFAVNLDGAESRTGLLPIDDLERLGVPLKPREVSVAQQLEQKRRLHDAELEDRQKVWRWLTFAAVVVLLGETWVAGAMTRRATLPTGAQI